MMQFVLRHRREVFVVTLGVLLIASGGCGGSGGEGDSDTGVNGNHNRFIVSLRFAEERSYVLEDIKSILIAKAKQYPTVYKEQWDDLVSFEKEMSELESLSELLSAFS